MTPRYCALIPTYQNPMTIRAMTLRVREHLRDVIVVDDGSSAEAREAVRKLGEEGLAIVHLRPQNGGKGAACYDGFRLAKEHGFTHALQIDADGQHDPNDIPKFVKLSQEHPEALILGQPVFDDSAPLLRRCARKITHALCALEVFSLKLGDPLCGYRVYPVEASLQCGSRGQRMDFDPEIAVRLFWRNGQVQRLKVKVRYLRPEEGGVSHYRNVQDTLILAWMHTRLICLGLLRAISWPWRALRGKASVP